ncbi:MAG: glycine zipper 2TM domain-containing protein [Gammaproteobacteria bacterium]|nr:glycine zipper 2TM domain-containing protein [Gammaproteobacteria bacterium]MBU1507904.1 glycine zipper 2TM domain-containing protein [Gammaproteobacteria bacterium]MBU2121402.1 glycine zipper 2TM domain-containing protein [Gammaproteobacteria bacterium]MBU2172263.1 glycine zipper 2TM domain-containing protein [Gammaproteobacteria bacterium]MBU2200289.1 glycine zipper 2TM domain-containing protein [Gammaproteobacteria bacterium]
MKISCKAALATVALAAAAHASAEITFYQQEHFQGRSFVTERRVGNFERFGFNDRASSVTVTNERWEVCEDARFSGRCMVLRPGQYPSLGAMGMNNGISSARNIPVDQRVDRRRYAPEPARVAAPAVGKIALFAQEGFGGAAFTTQESMRNLNREGFSNRASSAVVVGDHAWEVCDDERFSGRCMVLRPGQYPSLSAMGMNNQISSVRELERGARVDDRRYAPQPVAAPDYRRRRDERLFEADVSSVRAVVGTPQQRCWVEREQVSQNQVNAPGAVLGALLGGVLGHQVGGGSGKDIATAGGAIAGAVLGARAGNNGPATQDVQRCQQVPSQAQADYWDVTYMFKGEEHHIQMATPPGRTITVNARGEPRT